MNRLPPPQLLNTFRVAVVLKIVGTLTALATSKILVDQWHVNRWWMALATSFGLLVLLLPWGRWFPRRRAQVTQRTLIAALAFAILAPHLDLIQSLWVPFEPLETSPIFRSLGWTREQVYSIHALGGLFVMVPAVLASWHYGRWGLLLSLGLAGLLYVVTPLFLPAGSFPWLIYAVRGFVVLGTTLILAFTVYTLAAAQRRRAAELAAANLELEKANQQLAQQAATREQLAISRERNRLARELHDTLAHALSGTAVQLQAVGTLLKVNPAAAKEELATAQRQIKRGLEESRRAIAALRASPIEELGLVEALRRRVEGLAERWGIWVQCDLDALPALPAHVEQAVYRIADEALMNAEKYSQATQLHVDLRDAGDEVILTIWDNGVGFDVPDTLERPKDGRFGLLGMQERARLITAKLLIDSKMGKGTQIELNFRSA